MSRGVDVAVLGANNGFIGIEAAETLRGHPYVDRVLTPPSEELDQFEGADVVFSALPHGISAQYVEKFSGLGSMVVDFSGDLRFQTAEEYKRAYQVDEHPAPSVLSVPYGLPEHHRDQLKGRSIAAVPGCYPTGSLLPLQPLVEAGLLEREPMIVIDADSAVSGAGNNPSKTTHFMNVSGNATPYNTGNVHRHVPEIEQFLNGRSVFFSPMIIPIEQGMVIRINVSLVEGTDVEDVQEVLAGTYTDEPFVHVLEDGRVPSAKDTARTDECHIGAVGVGRTVQLISTLDNLRKGGSSQGVHVFNLMRGYPETAGLTPKASMR
ncbi:MAG TPA: N-acetyl-gamma-glutamyl-phosphate reductase [Candidatus Saccharimonadales bacterium]|nr:N-acetyl-gamma-glutamyl-phosphate reductase [Candidatus Saccharimonadales bacterium]